MFPSMFLSYSVGNFDFSPNEYVNCHDCEAYNKLKVKVGLFI